MTHNKPGILVFAGGNKIGGGSGFQEMKEYSLTDPPGLSADIVAVVSNHERGGVYKHSQYFNPKVPFRFWPGPFRAEGYQSLVEEFKPDIVQLSGWVKMTFGLDPKKTVNIHPGLLPGKGEHGEFGGQGAYGKNVHIAAIKAFQEKRIIQSGVTIHFVTEGYDEGPIIWKMPVLIRKEDTPKTLANRVNQVERAWQSHVVNLVANGLITLHGGPENWEVVVHRSLINFPGISATARIG